MLRPVIERGDPDPASRTEAIGRIGRESQARAAEARTYRRRRASWIPRAALALLAAVVAIGAVTLVLQHRHQGGVAQAQQQPATATLKPFPGAEGVPSRASFSDPHAYAAAMTRLALASGRTQLNGTPACDQTSTWDRWTCRARGKPTLGAYAGRWLTYRLLANRPPSRVDVRAAS